jgi:hypothetical protein
MDKCVIPFQWLRRMTDIGLTAGEKLAFLIGLTDLEKNKNGHYLMVWPTRKIVGLSDLDHRVVLGAKHKMLSSGFASVVSSDTEEVWDLTEFVTRVV